MSSVHRAPAHGESFTFLKIWDLGECTILSAKDAGMHDGFCRQKRKDLIQRNLSLDIKRSKFNETEVNFLPKIERQDNSLFITTLREKSRSSLRELPKTELVST